MLQYGVGCRMMSRGSNITHQQFSQAPVIQFRKFGKFGKNCTNFVPSFPCMSFLSMDDELAGLSIAAFSNPDRVPSSSGFNGLAGSNPAPPIVSAAIANTKASGSVPTLRDIVLSQANRLSVRSQAVYQGQRRLQITESHL